MALEADGWALGVRFVVFLSWSRPCMVRAPWSGLATLRERGTWSDGGSPKNPGTSAQCRRWPSPSAAQWRRENRGERKRSSVGDLTSSEAQSRWSSEWRWWTTVRDGGATSPWRIRGASSSAVRELWRARAWARGHVGRVRWDEGSEARGNGRVQRLQKGVVA